MPLCRRVFGYAQSVEAFVPSACSMIHQLAAASAVEPRSGDLESPIKQKGGFKPPLFAMDVLL
jgi:hypothetical protein